jgi:nitronate monooxygenase
MKASNRIAKLLNVRYPIFQAPMGRSAPPRLISEVIRAGGIGMYGASWDDVKTIEGKVAAIRASSTQPFAINLSLEYDQHERLAMALHLGVRWISLFWGDPRPYVDAIRRAKAVLIHTVGSGEEALKVQAVEADIIVAQGFEAGGHIRSTTSSMVLIPAVVDAVQGKVPVVCAGGIADERGVRAARALGAEGAWLGTRYIATPEAASHDVWKQRILAAHASDTVSTMAFDGGWPQAPHRVLRNSTYEQWQLAGQPAVGQRPGEGDRIAGFDGMPGITRYSFAGPLDGMTGDVDGCALYAGQSTELIHKIEGAFALTQRLGQAWESV